MSDLWRIIISGRVQGVGYREFARGTALLLGINGWVRNLPDGQVEIVAKLDQAQKTAFVEALEKGPPLALVDLLEVNHANTSDVPQQKGFKIRI